MNITYTQNGDYLMEKVFAGNGNFQGEDAGRKRP